MIERLAALILLSTLSLIQTIDIPHEIPLTVAELGENVTLTCAISENPPGLFYWYKMKFGYAVQTVATGAFYTVKLEGKFDSSRFAVTKVNNRYFLNIKNVSKEDEATYICQAGSVYLLQFGNGTVLAVNDQQKYVNVKQSSETGSVQPGEGTAERRQEVVIIVGGILLALCVIVIAILIFSRD